MWTGDYSLAYWCPNSRAPILDVSIVQTWQDDRRVWFVAWSHADNPGDRYYTTRHYPTFLQAWRFARRARMIGGCQ